MVPEPTGQFWCADLPNPLSCENAGAGDEPNNNPNGWICLVGVQEEINDGASDPRGCWCASEELSSDLTDIMVNGVAVVDDSEDLLLKEFRDAVYEDAEEKCETLAVNQGIVPPDDFHNCDYAVAQHLASNPGEYPPLSKEGQQGDCSAPANIIPGGADGGFQAPPSDNYTDYYTLSNEIWWSSSDEKYYINSDFFDDLVDNPGWLLNDSARIVQGGGGYKLTGVASGEIADALGLQDNDFPKTLNGESITSIAGMLEVHHDLLDAGETEFALALKRSGSVITINYEVR